MQLASRAKDYLFKTDNFNSQACCKYTTASFDYPTSIIHCTGDYNKNDQRFYSEFSLINLLIESEAFDVLKYATQLWYTIFSIFSILRFRTEC